MLDATDSTAYKSFIAVPGEAAQSIHVTDTKPKDTERRTWCMEKVSTHP